MDAVGRKVFEAFEAENTHGDSRAYGRRRVCELLDQLAEIPEAHEAIARAYNRSLAVTERRRKLAVVE